uniref:Cystathionine beta-synthase family protein n=1 Tax=Macrostomum lignano TaxID=282301 RepID=A0A1I8GJB5_9PLAT
MNDVDSLRMARRLIRREGLLCGGSSGSAFDCALRAVRDFGLGAGKRVVVLLPDSVRNYMTKFLSDDWMIERGHMPDPEDDPSLGPSHAWMSVRVGSLDLRAPLTVAPDVSVSETLELFNRESIDQLLNGPSGAIVGMATLSNITSRIIRGSLAPTDPVGSAAFDKFTKVTPDAKLGAVSRRLDTDHFVLVVQQQRQFGSAGEAVREFVYGILTRIDLLNFILKMQEIGLDLLDVTMATSCLAWSLFFLCRPTAASSEATDLSRCSRCLANSFCMSASMLASLAWSVLKRRTAASTLNFSVFSFFKSFSTALSLSLISLMLSSSCVFCLWNRSSSDSISWICSFEVNFFFMMPDSLFSFVLDSFSSRSRFSYLIFESRISRSASSSISFLVSSYSSVCWWIWLSSSSIFSSSCRIRSSNFSSSCIFCDLDCSSWYFSYSIISFWLLAASMSCTSLLCFSITSCNCSSCLASSLSFSVFSTWFFVLSDSISWMNFSFMSFMRSWYSLPIFNSSTRWLSSAVNAFFSSRSDLVMRISSAQPVSLSRLSPRPSLSVTFQISTQPSSPTVTMYSSVQTRRILLTPPLCAATSCQSEPAPPPTEAAVKGNLMARTEPDLVPANIIRPELDMASEVNSASPASMAGIGSSSLAVAAYSVGCLHVGRGGDARVAAGLEHVLAQPLAGGHLPLAHAFKVLFNGTHLAAAADSELFEGANVVNEQVHQAELVAESYQQEQAGRVQGHAVGLLSELLVQLALAGSGPFSSPSYANSLGLKVPNSNRTIHGAGGDQRFSRADVQSEHLAAVETVRQLLKLSIAAMECAWLAIAALRSDSRSPDSLADSAMVNSARCSPFSISTHLPLSVPATILSSDTQQWLTKFCGSVFDTANCLRLFSDGFSLGSGRFGYGDESPIGRHGHGGDAGAFLRQRDKSLSLLVDIVQHDAVTARIDHRLLVHKVDVPGDSGAQAEGVPQLDTGD